MISWVGGGEGYVNSNPHDSCKSKHSSVGLMHIPRGNRQRGLHYHSVAEIYVILKGEVMGWDGYGEVVRAGPLDCIYIPAGAPHGVRSVGGEEVDLIWIHDAIEKKGTSVYWNDTMPNPQTEPVQLVKFSDLEPNWATYDIKDPGHMHYMLSYVGGRLGNLNFNRNVAAESDNVGIGLLAIDPGNKQDMNTGATSELYILIRGKVIIKSDQKNEEMEYLDGLFLPAGSSRCIRNCGQEQALLVWVHEEVKQEYSGALYQAHTV
jgi:mannose-6-phosphate isomerase-like protein (cupin superfamily)